MHRWYLGVRWQRVRNSSVWRSAERTERTILLRGLHTRHHGLHELERRRDQFEWKRFRVDLLGQPNAVS